MNQPDQIPDHYLSDKELAALDEGGTISGPDQQPKWLHVGAICLARNGKKIRIICTDRTSTDPTRDIYRVLGLDERGEIYSFLSNGKSVEGMNMNPRDLIGPWIEAIPWPWDLLPPWTNWCAFSSGGTAYYFSRKPTMGVFSWDSANCMEIPSIYAPVFYGDWKLSLTERPKK